MCLNRTYKTGLSVDHLTKMWWRDSWKFIPVFSIGPELQCWLSHCSFWLYYNIIVQLLSCVWLCDPMDCSMPGFPVLHYHLEFAQACVHWVSDALQLSHPLLPPSPAFNLSQHQDLFQWVSSHTLWLFLVISWLELFKNTIRHFEFGGIKMFMF